VPQLEQSCTSTPTPGVPTPGLPTPGAEGSDAARRPVRSPDPEGERLVARVAALASTDPAHPVALDAAVRHWAPMAIRIAGSYRGRTSEPDDLRQVALTALVQAVLRYRPEVGAFPSYAVPCVTGEIRRWMRDFRGLVHVPRRVVELDVRSVAVEDGLVQRLGRHPSHAELGAALGVSGEAVGYAKAGRASRTLHTLDSPEHHRAAPGADDPRLSGVEDRVSVEPLLRRLDERSRTVLVMRYYGERTQSEIAHEIGVSQVQVSRIIRRSLDRMRDLAG
jgi:RNA polymerase sigma-B factor